jgi:hypothetical protein
MTGWEKALFRRLVAEEAKADWDDDEKAMIMSIARALTGFTPTASTSVSNAGPIMSAPSAHCRARKENRYSALQEAGPSNLDRP